MRAAAFVLLMVLVSVRPGWGQVPTPTPSSAPTLTLKTSLVFYGDDTEFSNPFRTGDTIVGTYGVAFLEVGLNDRFAVRAGGFGNWRFGSPDAIDQGRPVLALVAGDERSHFVLGTLETMRHLKGEGPDRTGPHGLLPPMQRETLSFDRAHEAGMQWIVDTPRFSHDAWINWQRLNTRFHREVFDAGYQSLTRLRPELAIRGDIHAWHQGGQHGGVEPVADSVAAAAGIDAGGPVARVKRLSLELYALGSRNVPDRSQPDLTRGGFATFLRFAADGEKWRVHMILWRANGFVKVEGDPLYQAVEKDGTRYNGIRDYGELGVTRRFTLAPDTVIETSLRLHRTEDNYEFSFRVLGVANLSWRLR
jgi:hypothetical protein